MACPNSAIEEKNYFLRYTAETYSKARPTHLFSCKEVGQHENKLDHYRNDNLHQLTPLLGEVGELDGEEIFSRKP